FAGNGEPVVQGNFRYRIDSCWYGHVAVGTGPLPAARAALGTHDQWGWRMNCREAQELIHGFVDSELGLVWNLEMERHIHECPSCSGAHERLRVMHTVLSDNSL